LPHSQSTILSDSLALHFVVSIVYRLPCDIVAGAGVEPAVIAQPVRPGVLHDVTTATPSMAQ
jgi:hypothetical protein